MYSSEHKDQNNVKKTSKWEISFYFKASSNILKVIYTIPKYKAQ